MTVYAIIRNDRESHYPIAIYSTRPLAEAAIKKFRPDAEFEPPWIILDFVVDADPSP